MDVFELKSNGPRKVDPKSTTSFIARLLYRESNARRRLFCYVVVNMLNLFNEIQHDVV